jgi:molybdopterin synthase sulfur carrier subunit
MRVKIFSTLRSVVGAKEVEVGAADTVGSVLEELITKHPALRERILDEDGNLQSSINILVNGRNIRFINCLDTPVKESDQLALFPPVGGG